MWPEIEQKVHSLLDELEAADDFFLFFLLEPPPDVDTLIAKAAESAAQQHLDKSSVTKV
jgi:hypothetical protein